MTTHTPGPWDVVRMVNPANARAIIGDGDTVVAIMPIEWNGCRYVKEDARLISAAPELLEALEQLSQWVSRAIVPEFGPRKPMPENCRKALDASSAAIVKAIGAAP